MKKSYLMIAAAAAMLAACSSNDTFKETTRENANQPFTFSVYADKVTKAANTNSASLQDFYTVFGVYGFKNVTRNGQATNEPVFSNEPNEYFESDAKGTIVFNGNDEKPSDEWKTSFTAGKWYYENIRYRDKLANSYAFFAIAPYEATPNPALDVEATYDNIKIGNSSDKYDISTEENLAIAGTPNAVPQENLKYSGFNKDYMLATKSDATSSDVTMLFHHILAKLNVKIVKATTYIGSQELKVNELKINGLAKEGYYVFDTDFATKGWTTNGTYARDIATDYSLTAATKYDGYYWIETLMFPQTTTCKALTAQSDATDLTDMYLYIKYQIGTETYEAYYDFAKIWGATVVNNGQGNNATNSYTFVQGNEYTLTLTVGPEPIHFDAQVTQWADTTNPIVASQTIN